MMHSTNLQDADLLAMLCLPCIGDAEKMRQVGTRLGISLPVSIGTVASVAEELELSGTREGVLGYYAAARTGAWPAGGADLFPHQVLLQVRATGAGTREGRVLLPGLDRAEIAHAIQYDEHQFRPLSQVLHDFDATCLIICAIPSDPGPPGM